MRGWGAREVLGGRGADDRLWHLMHAIAGVPAEASSKELVARIKQNISASCIDVGKEDSMASARRDDVHHFSFSRRYVGSRTPGRLY